MQKPNESYADQYKQEDTEQHALDWYNTKAKPGFDQSLMEEDFEQARAIIQDTLDIGLEAEAKEMMKELTDAVQLESDRQINEDKKENY